MIIDEFSWNEEMSDEAVLLQLDGAFEDHIEDYYSPGEIEADYHERMALYYEDQLRDLTTPSWSYLFAMDGNSSEEHVGRLLQTEKDHFENHRSEIQDLKEKRDYHFSEWKFYVNL